ncbi:polyprenyl synthetase family protein [Nocardia asiatica]|uniref:polyprenyl synthetase family protein n=1 Tax=Nocardia asiatica TaxID=209252 RepID=UPI003EE20A30
MTASHQQLDNVRTFEGEMANLAACAPELPEIDRELEFVVGFMKSTLVSEVAELTEVSSHLLSGTSKLFRPRLVLACAARWHPVQADPRQVTWPEEARELAAAIELLHVSSLYHDDIMDNADDRRGLPSANRKYGVAQAILAGDFLLAKIMEIAGRAGSEYVRLISDAYQSLCLGQAMEMRDRFSVERSVDDYLTSIRGKTAALLSAACAVGAMAGDYPEADVARLAKFGEHLGLAFQMVDDILDICADPGSTGKRAMQDVVSGVYTLPVIEMLRREPEFGETLQQAGPEDLPGIRAHILRSGGVDIAAEAAAEHIGIAVSAIEQMSDRRVTESLASIARMLELVLHNAPKSL